MNRGNTHHEGHEAGSSRVLLPFLGTSCPSCLRGEYLRGSWNPRRTAAFTLLEVVLALSLAIGLLAVVLVFYQQSARLRDQTLADAAGLSAVRLTLDRLANELHTATLRPGTFHGGPHDLEFLRCPAPDPAASSMAAAAPADTATTAPRFPLRRLRYRLADTSANTTATTATSPDTTALERTGGVERIDEPAESPEPLGPAPDETEMGSTNEVPAVPFDSLAPTNPVTSIVTTASAARLLIPELRFFSLRYWDGLAWQESWDGPGAPLGVEIRLATEAPPATAPADTPPLEVFRRVVALPTAVPTDLNTLTNGATFATGRTDASVHPVMEAHRP